MDYSSLRAAAMRDGEDEEAVTVDTRALIDKVLARYSGEWTTLRELVQNAADAQATTVSVKWETLPSTSVPLPNAQSRSEQLKHIISNHTLRRLVVQNDGQPFTKTDWGRLKRIAEATQTKQRLVPLVLAFTACLPTAKSPSLALEAKPWRFTGKATPSSPRNRSSHKTRPRLTLPLCSTTETQRPPCPICSLSVSFWRQV